MALNKNILYRQSTYFNCRDVMNTFQIFRIFTGNWIKLQVLYRKDLGKIWIRHKKPKTTKKSLES